MVFELVNLFQIRFAVVGDVRVATTLLQEFDRKCLDTHKALKLQKEIEGLLSIFQEMKSQ